MVGNYSMVNTWVGVGRQKEDKSRARTHEVVFACEVHMSVGYG